MDLKRLEGVTDGWAFLGIESDGPVTRMAVVRGDASGLHVVVQRYTVRGADAAPIVATLRYDVEGGSAAESADVREAEAHVGKLFEGLDAASDLAARRWVRSDG